MKPEEHHLPVRTRGVNCTANLIFGNSLEIFLIPGCVITAIEKGKSPAALASGQQKLAIAAEGIGVFGVELDSTSEEVFGGIMVDANIGEEEGVVA